MPDDANTAWPFLDGPRPLAFAHRGGDEHAPENTVAAFRHATSLGFQYLETDVHRTRDGVLVAFHDSGLQRIAGLDGSIAEHRWDELARLDLGGGNTMPTLDQLLETFPEARFNIDPKADDSVDPLADTIDRHAALDRVCVGSFSDRRIDELRSRLGPRLCTSPGPRGVARLTAAAMGAGNSNRGHGCVQLPIRLGPMPMTRRLVDGFHRLGLQVHVWTVNRSEDMHRMLDLGVDGIMTDRTELLKTVLVERGQWVGGTITDSTGDMAGESGDEA